MIATNTLLFGTLIILNNSQIKIMEKYTPFGPDWEKEMMKMNKASLLEILGAPETALKKKELVKLIRTKLIIEQFNDTYPIGSSVNWRSTPYSELSKKIVKSKAFPHFGTPVVFFENHSGFCSIEPEFIL